jgi:Uma2 family endonuclease
VVEAAEKRMSVAEFLTWNDGTDTRYELIDGRAVTMPPVAPGHPVIVVNLGAALHGNLRAPCYAGAIAGVILPECDDTFYVADLVVSETPLRAGGWTIPQPTVVIEVLSPSTVEHDRGCKAYDYRRIPSVQEIALVASEQRYVEIWRRLGAKWELEDLIGDAALELETVGVAIPFAAIYADSGV